MTATEGVRRAAILLDLGRAAEAEQLIGPLLAAAPEDAALLRLLARAQAEQDRPRDAEHTLRLVLRSDPDDPEAWAHLSALRADAKDAAGAIDAAEAVARLAPHSWVTYYTRARALMTGPRPHLSAALADINNGLRLDPHNAHCHNLAGACLEALRRFDDARSAYEEALRLDPQHPLASANLARLDTESGRLRSSSDRVRSALANHPGEEALRGTLALVATRTSLRLSSLLMVTALVSAALLVSRVPLLPRVGAATALVLGSAILWRTLADHLPDRSWSWWISLWRSAPWQQRLALALPAPLIALTVVFAGWPTPSTAVTEEGLTGFVQLALLTVFAAGSAWWGGRRR
ncbi:tetratricopeptide repeat protein [Nocardioides acrostichi]|uniref:Tetratricopeptide repeat protein n=1 Tax=Nocardioides acrostichi TaxID=2784339 RepID=A0A930Y622_9ACTN|nr:tetratricopeptide repeat protein [Nocardioides acrostichi]MBF4160492.1 tetratricopeptide repeat protein [Nocardioides acrostichi]